MGRLVESELLLQFRDQLWINTACTTRVAVLASLSDLTGLFVVPIDAVDEQTALDVVLPWFEGTPERTDRPDGTVWFTGATTEGVVIGPVSDQEVALIRFDEQTVVALALVTAVGELPVDRSVLETVAASVVAAS